KDYRDYLRQHAPATLHAGPIVNGEGEELGRHEGVAFYTVGQRRGLGLASTKPLFVSEIKHETNTLVVGDEALLYQTEASVASPNWVAIEALSEPLRVSAKARYKAEEVPATIEPGGAGVRVRFDEPQRAITPGQTIVFYDGDVVVGGGTIEGAAWSCRACARFCP